MFKKLDVKIVDYIEKYIRCTNISDKSVCMLFRILHYIMPIVFVIIMLIGSKSCFEIVIFFNIVILMFFLIFNGCILSKLEHRFTDENFTVIDPFLEIINIKLTNENRKKYTLYFITAGNIVLFTFYYFRFVKEED